jgi:Mrp family chromosome partitioning ATPase
VSAAAPAAQATAEQIAAVDRLMSEYVSRRREIDRELASLQSRGFGAGHDSVKQVKSELSSLDRLISEYTTLWNSNQAVRQAADGAPGVVPLGEPIEVTRARLAALHEQANGWRQEAVTLGNKRLIIEGKQREIADAEKRLEEVTRRLDEINIESKVEQTIGRIEVIYPESAPSTPTVDPRKKYAILGGGAAGGAVVCLAFLIGLIDRRCRYSDEVDKTVDGKLLACLPVMNSDTAEMETMAAVHAVHRVRAQMQIVSPEFRTVAVPSANAGDGKTSVCLALGISFANVGRRTLIIDLDLVGHGLSSRMRMTAGAGVLDALTASSPDGLTRPSHVPMLDILPVGGGGDWSPARLRREEIQALLRNAAELYDTVLIDTGPLLGSLEANFVCASADAVLVIVGRGQSRTLVQRVLQNVRDLNANLLGVVFNRAKDTDFRSSTVSASVRSVRDHPGASSNGKESRNRADVDPLADAVFVDALHADQHVHGGQGKASPAA